MLVLTRKPQETIRIGENIVVTVLKTKGKTVRLGIEAPHDVAVLRGEIAFDGDESAADASDSEEQAAAPRTLHSRVPREQAASILPNLISEEGPLAAMMQRRAATVTH